ncbi:MAG: hypothetical protein KGN01_03190 [Patescibacteria group bacterium]|nr:hypothetical protein [Patescibacteria group bacterium]
MGFWIHFFIFFIIKLYVVLWCFIALHELGHVIAAWMMGLTVDTLIIGRE